VDMTKRNRIVLNCDHDDRQRAGRRDRLLETLLVPGGFHDDVDFAPDEIPNRLAHAIHPIPGVDELEGEILSFDVPKLAHPLIESHPEGECPRIWRRRTHTQYPRWSLLRARRERPRCRAAEQHDELATLHSITSSASASSVGGISRPSAFAVFRLMTNSNLVACITGRSAGFSPLRTRPV